MFMKKWNQNLIRSKATLKTSLVSKLKENACKCMPKFHEIQNILIPKKKVVTVYHVEDHSHFYSIDGSIVLFENDEGKIFPFLKVAIEYPNLIRSVCTSIAAMLSIKKGANLMIRGAWCVDETYEKNEIVKVCLEKQKIPYAIGYMAVSGPEVLQAGDGPAVIIVHILKDGLWEAQI